MDWHSTLWTELHMVIGAAHDGEEDAVDCKAEDEFIMNPYVPTFDPNKMYSRNPWQFSNCTVRNFKTSLKAKRRVCQKPQQMKGNF
ncbi:hypothetical protein CHS0354_031934 [Potamilus streckersoni]|uniref:Peptidase M12B domain-containing protein n=1 Tax=Potamilus streckersoni TaxID=2493646 RepID=A0AAE0W153_9BIVA|nr:hypothetical protein CHS0354_031934 [Potamilus streckersoni]